MSSTLPTKSRLSQKNASATVQPSTQGSKHQKSPGLPTPNGQTPVQQKSQTPVQQKIQASPVEEKKRGKKS